MVGSTEVMGNTVVNVEVTWVIHQYVNTDSFQDL
jgi:hypothetical protein